MKAPVSRIAISAAFEALMLHQPEPTNPTFCTCGWDLWHIYGDDLLLKHIAQAVAEASAPFIAASALRDFARGDVADHHTLDGREHREHSENGMGSDGSDREKGAPS